MYENIVHLKIISNNEVEFPMSKFNFIIRYSAFDIQITRPTPLYPNS
ncbi:hypothetical protein FHS11_003233 [Mucilaginibacter gotjawali]|uniref:Uncharacterized protein n=1 Tax=Mucilaginibacter gotjawali TaxID=1550579 RepID=A0A839SJZ1_9SPHI|nr:hypothetical protein [Mucilaginibacter gotjawali]